MEREGKGSFPVLSYFLLLSYPIRDEVLAQGKGVMRKRWAGHDSLDKIILVKEKKSFSEVEMRASLGRMELSVKLGLLGDSYFPPLSIS